MDSMYDPEAWASTSTKSFAKSVNRIYNFTYGWMAFGLILSGLVAWILGQHLQAGSIQFSKPLFYGCAITELILVITLSAAIFKLRTFVAGLLFILYALLNGATMSLIFLCYNLGTIQSVFFITAGSFAALSLFGTLTSINLNTIGRIAIMGLLGIIIASIVNFFMASSGLNSILTYAGVIVFTALTAYDAQKVRILAEQQAAMDNGTIQRLGLLCALELYLDFINLFLYLLRIFGGKGRD